MALSLIDGKVQLRSDNGTWYEFPLVRLLNRVTEGDIVEAAEVAANADVSAYLEVDEGNGETSLHRVYFVTGQDDRQYLEIDQEEAESDAVENGPMRLTVDGQSYDYTIFLAGEYDVQLYGYWPDLSNSTWPTKERDAMTITIVDKLTGEED